jgi:hypothetical protein
VDFISQCIPFRGKHGLSISNTRLSITLQQPFAECFSTLIIQRRLSLDIPYVERTRQLLMQHPHQRSLGNLVTSGQPPGTSTRGSFYGTQIIILHIGAHAISWPFQRVTYWAAYTCSRSYVPQKWMFRDSTPPLRISLPREAMFVALHRKVDTMLPRTNLPRVEPNRSGSLSRGEGISACSFS